jgi:hypothetical protein
MKTGENSKLIKTKQINVNRSLIFLSFKVKISDTQINMRIKENRKLFTSFGFYINNINFKNINRKESRKNLKQPNQSVNKQISLKEEFLKGIPFELAFIRILLIICMAFNSSK